MNSLTIRPTREHPSRLNLRGIVPNRVLEMSVSEIQNLTIDGDLRPERLDNWFEVVDGNRDRLVAEGDLSHCDGVAGDMRDGIFEIHGAVGDQLATGMSGGRLIVHGSAGRFAGSGLRGGYVEIAGDVGEYAAGAGPGKERGMSGGMMLIRGSCGRWLASRMRRGIVMVDGDIDQGCASRMLAGTVVACGRVALPMAAGLSRGTLLLLEPRDEPAVDAERIPGFTLPEPTELSFLPILLRDIAQYLPRPKLAHAFPRVAMRSLGDRADGGYGEILWTEQKQTVGNSAMAHA